MLWLRTLNPWSPAPDAPAIGGGRPQLTHADTDSPNKLTSSRDVPREVQKRLEKAGFKAQLALDGVLATRR